MTWRRRERGAAGRRGQRVRRRGCEALEQRLALAASYVGGELLVQFAEDATPAAVAAVRAAVGGVEGQSFRSMPMRLAALGSLDRLRLPAGADVLRSAAVVARMPGVLFAEPNYRLTKAAVSNDPYYTTSSRLWGMYGDDQPSSVGPSGTTNQFGSQAEKAWNAGYTGSKQVVVGIIDEGVDVTHPDLAANIWVNPFETANDGVDNDGNGFVDDVNGWDFNSNDKTVYDGSGDDHGTHVAGTVGAVGGNAAGVVGVNWNVTMISAKFMGPNGGTTANAVRAIDYLTDLKQRHGINIVATCNSWGGGGYSAALHSAIIRGAKAGILFVAAAGNDSSNNDSVANYPSNYSTLVGTSSTTPASYDAVIAVAAITSTGGLASYSNYGRTTVDIGAPGSGIFSTLPGGQYGSYNGTSMATPHVAGAVALYASVKPTATAADIRTAILSNARPTSSLSGRTVTGGRLDVFAAIGSASGPTLSIADVTVTEGNTGTTQATLTLTLSAASTSAVTVQYATADGTATTADADYQAQTGTVSFAAGETQKTITILVTGDNRAEVDETFGVTLSNATGATISRAAATVTISNDDGGTPPSLPRLTVQDVAVAEGNAGVTRVTLVFTLSMASASGVTVTYATADGTATTADGDYQATSGTLTFGTGEILKTVTLTVNGDTKVEATETFTVSLSNLAGATLTGNSATVTITNDDSTSSVPTVTISGPDAVAEGQSGTRNVAFDVTLSRALAQVTTVDVSIEAVSATAGKDYRGPARTTLVFSPLRQVVRVLVSIIGDREVEADETFRIVLSRPVGVTLGAVFEKTVTIVNDDAAGTVRSQAAGPSTAPRDTLVRALLVSSEPRPAASTARSGRTPGSR